MDLLRYRWATRCQWPAISRLCYVSRQYSRISLGPKLSALEDFFINRLLGFYHGDATKIAAEDRLWFIQLLLIFSFGTAFRSGSRSSRGAPGSSFFVRAMSLKPDHASLWKHSVLAIETLALSGLYLYLIGERESGHIYASLNTSGLAITRC